jgi:nicotinamidase-related amidase
MQAYFLDPGSHAFAPSAPAIVPNIEKLIRFAILNHMPFVFTRHINQAGSAGNMDIWWRDMITEENPLSGIIQPFIKYLDNDPGAKMKVFEKSQYDAFFQTGLDQFLQSENIRQVIISGVLTNLCCETTARSAFVRGYEVFFPVDATAAYNLDLHLSTFKNMAFGFSPVITTEDLIKNSISHD